MKKNLVFVSLFWKTTGALALIFLSLIAAFTYFNASQLSNVYEQNRHSKQEQYLVEYNGLIAKAESDLSKLIDSMPLLETEEQSLVSQIDKHWLSLQITWGLESAAIIDESGDILNRWGDKRVPLDPKKTQRVRDTGIPIHEMYCIDDCRLVVDSPLITKDGRLLLAQVSISLSDTMLDFKRITGADIGLLTTQQHSNRKTLGNNELGISALTNRDKLGPLIHRFAREQAWEIDLKSDDEPLVKIIDTPFSQFEVMMQVQDQVSNGEAVVAFISDTTTEREQIKRAQETYVATGLLATITALILIVTIFLQPIRSIQRQASALPLLAIGRYEEAKEKLARMAPHRVFADEISQLQDTSLDVTEKLENFHNQLTKNNEKLHEMAHFDTLTDLCNRAYLIELMENKLEHDNPAERNFALIYLDLDNFKHINDALGHNIGDSLLIVVAKRLKGCVEESDYVARFGGDEFCIILSATNSEKKAVTVAEKILEVLEEPVAIEGRSLNISTSIGITLAPDDGDSTAALIQNADLAMYQAKSAGKNKYHLFNRKLHEDADTRIALEEELRRAVKRNEFILHYQPQVNLESNSLIGCEALIRWQHPERGVLAPFFFIEALENNGLIIPVGKWLIKEACRQISEWSSMGLNHIKVSLNISARQFSDPDLVKDVTRGIAEMGIKASQLELEVTESLLATDIKHAIDVLNELRDVGVSIAIDDFGTGYSSLAYLKQLPLDKLKVDRAFVKDIPEDKDDMQISSAIVAMAHSLNLRVVAEGVETAEQQDFLSSLRCEYGQGYYFAKPISPEEFVAHPLVEKHIHKS